MFGRMNEEKKNNFFFNKKKTREEWTHELTQNRATVAGWRWKHIYKCVLKWGKKTTMRYIHSVLTIPLFHFRCFFFFQVVFFTFVRIVETTWCWIQIFFLHFPQTSVWEMKKKKKKIILIIKHIRQSNSCGFKWCLTCYIHWEIESLSSSRRFFFFTFFSN